MLHHSSDLRAACREVFRVLKPGGRFIAVREHVISSKGDLPEFLAKHPLHKIYGGEQAFLLEEYLSAFAIAGFSKPAVVSPLRSPINLSPQNEEGLRREVCLRLLRYAPAAKILERILAFPPLSWGFVRLLTLVDNRPGRLYSFIADKR